MPSDISEFTQDGTPNTKQDIFNDEEARQKDKTIKLLEKLLVCKLDTISITFLQLKVYISYNLK